MDTKKFSILAEVRGYFNEVRAFPTTATMREDLLGLTGLLPEHDAALHEQIAAVDSVASSLSSITQQVNLVRDVIDAEYTGLLNHMSSHEWFKEQLGGTSKETRAHWNLYEPLMNHLIVEFSSIPQPWKYPMCSYSAQHVEIINLLLASEVLYMVDTDRALLEQQYNEADPMVRLRLKYHIVDDFVVPDFNPTSMYSDLRFGAPVGQMALVSAINIFERFPAETLQLCLTEVKKLLRPGGRIVFNVFDAHTPSVARQMSEGTISGITKQQMSSIANALGLNITTWTKVFANDFVVVTLTAPGQLQSSKTDPSRAVRRKS